MLTLDITETICLRELSANDVSDIFFAIDSQRAYLGRWLPFVEQTRTPEDTRRFVEEALAATPYEYLFTLRVDGVFAGLTGFKSTDQTARTTEIGYWMCARYQGQGIMTRAVATLCRFAFKNQGIRLIEIRCAPKNQPSNRLAQRLGFTLDHTEPHAEILTGGEVVDAHVYRLYNPERSDQCKIPVV